QFQSFWLDVPGSDCVQVDEPRSPDAFSGPRCKISELLQYDPTNSFVHRLKVTGTVTHAQQDFFAMQDETGGIWVKPKSSFSFSAGDVVEVVGFPEGGGFSPVLAEAITRKAGSGQAPDAQFCKAAQVFSGEKEALLARFGANLLNQRINGSNL